MFQDIDYDGFRKFLDTFLEVNTPEELCRHLFLSFVRKGVKVEGKAFKEMAVLSSTTACAPITSHNKGNHFMCFHNLMENRISLVFIEKFIIKRIDDAVLPILFELESLANKNGDGFPKYGHVDVFNAPYKMYKSLCREIVLFAYCYHKGKPTLIPHLPIYRAHKQAQPLSPQPMK